MEADVDRMTRLAEQMLILARIEQQDHVLTFGEVDLQALWKMWLNACGGRRMIGRSL